MANPRWRVGEVAAQSGLTVRTLHHYDEIGLLRPSSRSDSGYRLYDHADITRLQKIVSLRELGLSLDEILDLLDRPAFELLSIIELQMARVQARIVQQQTLYDRLAVAAGVLRSEGELPVEVLFNLMEEIKMIDRYYTPEQLEQLKKRYEDLGEDNIRAVEQEWPPLISRMRAAMDAGTDPAAPEVQHMAARWKELTEMFTGGDSGIRQSLQNLWENEAAAMEERNPGIDPELMEYVSKAWSVQND